MEQIQAILPRQADNAYRGQKLALWLFVVIVALRTTIGFNSMFNGHSVAVSADGIPLDTFAAPAVQEVVALFAVWGLAQLLISLISVVVLVRYRALVPLMFVVFLLDQLGRKAVHYLIPTITTAGPTPAPWINLALLSMMVIGLVLSLWSRNTAARGV